MLRIANQDNWTVCSFREKKRIEYLVLKQQYQKSSAHGPVQTLLACLALLLWPGLQCTVDGGSEAMFKGDKECW